MIVTIVLILVVAAALIPLLQRDLRRAVERQRIRAWLRANPEIERIRQQFVRVQIEFADKLTPALQEVARAFDELASKVRGAR